MRKLGWPALAPAVLVLSMLAMPGVAGAQEASPAAPGGSPGPAWRIGVAGTTRRPPAGLSVQLPAGWTGFEFGARRETASDDHPRDAALFVSVVVDTYADPCGNVPRTPRIGPSADDLVAALGEIPGVTADAPVPGVLAGRAATMVRLTVGPDQPCAPTDLSLWQDSPGNRWWTLDEQEVLEVWVLDIAGERVAIATRTWPHTSETARAELQAVLDSVAIADVTGG